MPDLKEKLGLVIIYTETFFSFLVELSKISCPISYPQSILAYLKNG